MGSQKGLSTTMPLTKAFMSSLNEIMVPNHKDLARSLIRRALNDRKKLSYMGTNEQSPLFVITEEHFKAEIPQKHHDRIPKIIDEMRRYMVGKNLATNESPSNRIFLTVDGIDFGEAHWWLDHPIWFGTLLGGLISFFSGLSLALIKHYWLKNG